jgi:predicted outer membrane repeat protein
MPKFRRRLGVEQLEDRNCPTTFTVTNLNDSGAGSLRDAVNQIDQLHSHINTTQIVDEIDITIAGTIKVLSPLNLNHATTVKGMGENATFLDGGGTVNIWFCYPNDDSSITVANQPSEQGLLTTMQDMTMENGFTTNGLGGGAVYARNDICFENVCFMNNVSTGFGGAVSGQKQIMATNCEWENNVSQGDGGAINDFGNSGRGNTLLSLNIDHCEFIGNTATSSGGGIFLYSNNIGTNYGSVTNSAFTNNVAPNGPAIYLHQEYLEPPITVDTTGDTFTGNNPPPPPAGSPPAPTQTIFQVTNLNDAGPGSFRAAIQAASSQKGSATVDEIDFTVSGTFNLLSTLTLTHATLIKGEGQTLDTIQGNGTFQLLNCSAEAGLLNTIQGLTFTGGYTNTGYGGGAICAGGDVLLENDTFVSNKSAGFGGAVAALANVTVLGCEFDNNSGSTGGALISEGGGNVSIDHTNFVGNSATGNGGALYIYANAKGTNTATVTNCTFSGDTAKSGSAIFVHQSYLQPKVIVDVTTDVLNGETIVE